MKKIISICLMGAAGLFVSCISKHHTTMKNTTIFPIGDKATTYFTGDAWVNMLTTDVAHFDAMTYIVTFAPGSRNYWHSHPGGQILLCTSGKGFYQEKGKDIQLLQAGDVVEILPNVVHWHGATPESEFTHIGITTQASKNVVVWMEQVSDEEYNSFNK